MKGHGEKLSRKKEQTIAALLTSRTSQEAAKIAGIHANTLSRWQEDGTFREAYLAARRQVMSHAVARAQQLASMAVSYLAVVMRDEKAPPACRVSAAKALLQIGETGLVREDLEIRVDKCEKQIKARK